MALSRVKTWNAAETLTASDLNAEFNNICNHFGSLTNADIDSTASYVMGELVVGTGITSADGGQLHVHTATAGTIQAVADADEAVFENSGASGITILSGATSTGNIAFGDSGDADNGLIKYTHGSTPTLGVTVAATAVQSIAAAATTLAHDLEIYQDVNNADSAIKIGTSATEALFVEALNGGSNKTLEELRFTTKTASGTANHGKYALYVDEAHIADVDDSGINLASGKTFRINGTSVISGLGDFSGPGSSTDNAIVRFDGTGGKTGQTSSVLIDDSNNVSGIGTLAAGATTISGDTVISNGYGLIVGNGSQVTANTIVGEVQQLGTANADTTTTFGRWSADATSSRMLFVKSRNGTIGSSTIVQDDDDLGNIGFVADDGSDFAHLAASITASVDGTPGANDVPGRLVFATTADGASSPTERLRISSAGSLSLGATAVGGSPGAGSVEFQKDGNNYVRFWDNATATFYMQSNAANAPTTAMKNSDSDSLDITTFQRSNAGGNLYGQSRNGLMLVSGAPNGSFAVGTSNAKNLVLGTNNTAAVTIDSSQNVGIAMSPGGSHKLDVTGSAGLSTGTAWTNTSDARIKKDVATITGATAKLKRLRPVSYRYTDQYLSVHSEIDGSKTYHSFVADEYETVFPDAVSIQGNLVKITPAVSAVQAQDAVLYIDGDTDIPDGKSVGDVRTPAVEAVEGREEVKETLLTDIKQFTPHDLQMFVVAAVQELDARIAALESA